MWPSCITDVTADAQTSSLRIGWSSGAVTVKDMRPLIAAKRVFRPLADPDLFAKVHIIHDGRALAWNDDIDYCADALWYEAHPEDNPFLAAEAAQ